MIMFHPIVVSIFVSHVLVANTEITLGDFWAIEKYCLDYDGNRETSFVLVNTRREYFEKSAKYEYS